MTRPEYEDEAYRLRAARIKRLLLIYVTQLAGRLGWTNMVPENLRVTDPAFAPRKRRASVDGKTPETNTTVSNSFNYIPDLELDDQIIHCWAGISNAMRIGNEKLFKSRQYTTRIIQDGSYVELLKDFQPLRGLRVEPGEGDKVFIQELANGVRVAAAARADDAQSKRAGPRQ